MNTPWRILLWKELREQWAVTLAILVVLLVVPPLTAGTDIGNLYFGIAAVIVFAMPLFAVFVGMGIASGEHSRGTIRFLQAIPVQTSRPAIAKLIVGLLTLILPILIATGLFNAWDKVAPRLLTDHSRLTAAYGMVHDVWGISSFFVNIAVIGSAVSASLLIWTVATGANRKDEISAGALAVLAIVAAYGSVFGLLWLLSKLTSDPSFMRQEGWLHPLIASLPGLCGFTTYHNGAASLQGSNWFGHFGPYLIVALLSHAVLIRIFLRRYGRVSTGRSKVGLLLPKSKQRDWLATPRQSAFTAVAWKTWRELRPMLAVGIGLLSILYIGGFCFANTDNVGWAFGMWCYIGGFVAIALGIGAFREDLEPGLHTFWNSRPASVDQWFWTKFSLGLLMVFLLGVFGIATSVVSILAASNGLNSRSHIFGDYLSTVAVTIGVHVGLYCGAVMLINLARRPIITAAVDIVLLIGAIYLIVKLLELLGVGDADPAGVVLGVMLATMMVAGLVLLAWQAFRNDWSLERLMK